MGERRVEEHTNLQHVRAAAGVAITAADARNQNI
jgi:hypothetical protein